MRYETTTKLGPEDALSVARDFFATDLGLDERPADGLTVRFEGGGGSVEVSAYPRDGRTVVEVVAVEWDYQAREFLGKVRRR